jgi:hypothetical protein
METSPRHEEKVKLPDDKSVTDSATHQPAATAAGAPPPRQPWPLKWIILAVVLYALIYNLCLLIWN